MKNRKASSGTSIGLIVFALVLLINPTVRVVDIFPDFIACFIIVKQLAYAAYRAPFFEEARDAFKKIAYLSILKLPAFIIMILVVTVMRTFINYKGTQAVLGGIRPCAIALILGTSLTLFMSSLLGISGGISNGISPDVKGLIILALIFAIGFGLKKLTKKKPSPILMIGISAVLGIIFYELI